MCVVTVKDILQLVEVDLETTRQPKGVKNIHNSRFNVKPTVLFEPIILYVLLLMHCQIVSPASVSNEIGNVDIGVIQARKSETLRLPGISMSENISLILL